jgi:hypothetical protein
MAIVGFNFMKISFEKSNKIANKISVSNNVSITSIEEANILDQSPQSALRFKYLFTSRYDPDFAKIDMEGEIVFVEKDEKVKEIMKGWKKSKQIDKEIMKDILNTVLQRCFVQAIAIGKDMNLPSIIPLPKLEDKILNAQVGANGSEK